MGGRPSAAGEASTATMIWLADAALHLAMGITTWAYLVGLRRQTDRSMLWYGLALGLLATLGYVLAIAWAGGGSVILAVRLLAWALFVHGPITLLGAAWIARRSLPRASISLGIAALVTLAIAYEAFITGPYRLEVSRVELRSAKLKAPLRIAVLADIQTDDIGHHEEQAIRLAVEANPDLILLPGDYIQEHDPVRRAELVAQLRALFAERGLRARLGVVAVRGNVDGHARWAEVFNDLGVDVVGNTRRIRFGERDDLEIIALDVYDSFNRLVSLERSERFQIALGHAPDFVLGDHGVDLSIAGHTHGGQVQIPWIGPLITFSRVPRAWASGTNAIGAGRTLVVSNGIGMERSYAPRLRFNCPPQVVIIDVAPTD